MPCTALLMDLPAVVAGLTLPYSNGAMEGVNTKVNFLKRKMCGRAGFPSLERVPVFVEVEVAVPHLSLPSGRPRVNPPRNTRKEGDRCEDRTDTACGVED